MGASITKKSLNYGFTVESRVSSKSEPIPGISDLFPEETNQWQYLEGNARDMFSKYSIGEIRTPIFERTDVFLRSIGDETDIVQKEMYTFKDRGDRSLTLRPEGTAGVLRAIANKGLSQGDEHRVYYIGPMFRGERPAAGRKRQFHQIGVEYVGKVSPEIDSECIILLLDYLNSIDITDTKLLINTRGVSGDRQQVSAAMLDYYKPHIDHMCEDCQRRYHTNIWRILDCKNDDCKTITNNAPSMIDLISDTSKTYFDSVCDILNHTGVQYEIDPQLVRGLDYYVHTVFEVVSNDIGAQDSIAGGGRYEIQPPGQKHPLNGVGFAMGVERLLLARNANNATTLEGINVDIYIVSLGQPALLKNFDLASSLRKQGFRVLMDLEKRGMKAQMRTANKVNAKITLIRGQSELDKGIILLKNMDDSSQINVKIDELKAAVEAIINRL